MGAVSDKCAAAYRSAVRQARSRSRARPACQILAAAPPPAHNSKPSEDKRLRRRRWRAEEWEPAVPHRTETSRRAGSLPRPYLQSNAEQSPAHATHTCLQPGQHPPPPPTSPAAAVTRAGRGGPTSRRWPRWSPGSSQPARSRPGVARASRICDAECVPCCCCCRRFRPPCRAPPPARRSLYGKARTGPAPRPPPGTSRSDPAPPSPPLRPHPAPVPRRSSASSRPAADDGPLGGERGAESTEGAHGGGGGAGRCRRLEAKRRRVAS